MTEIIKTAFATWNDRIAPVFDVSQRIQLVEPRAGRIFRQTQASMGGELQNRKASRLAGLGVGVLVCGAISAPMRAMVATQGSMWFLLWPAICKT